MTIKVQKEGGDARYLPNCTLLNGKVVGVEPSLRFKAYWNGARLIAAGKKDEAMALPRLLTAPQIAEWTEFLFEIGDNGDGYIVSVHVPEKRKVKKTGYNSIFGASSDGEYE